MNLTFSVDLLCRCGAELSAEVKYAAGGGMVLLVKPCGCKKKRKKS